MDEASDNTAGYDLSYDGISAMDQTERIDFVKFLSRPVKIASFIWAESDSVATERNFFPWQLFFTNPAVRDKLNNFAFISCKLKVKVLINASPFYYGAMLMSYQPLQTLTPSTIVFDSVQNNHFIPTSQRPHLWLYPQGNIGGEMTLPFFYQKNFIDAQSGPSMIDMGQLTFTNYTTLQSANGVSSAGATIAIYAWAEDVRISGPSVGLATQSGTADEYGNGPISGPASAIANSAKWFENIPVIGKFATATRIGASAVSEVSSLFGFTNVPVIADTQPFRPEPFPKMASGSIGYPVEKLTLDPKNELTVDPTVLGLPPVDEMALGNLVTRDSYLTTTEWQTSQVEDTILFTSRVSGMMYANSVSAAQSRVYLTTVAWASAMFQNWRGDVIYKFKVIASPYHKGRIRISYDPSGSVANNIINTPNSANMVFTTIIDLGETDEAEVRVPYQQATAFLQNRNLYTTAERNFNTSLTPTFQYSPEYDNGTIQVRVQTVLTAPIASSAINIIISVRGGENYELANPRTLPQLSTFGVQSGTVSDTLGTAIRNPHEDRYLINYGESVKSIRQLLRRTTLSGISSTSVIPNGYSLYQKRFTKLPPDYGFDPNGLHLATGLIAPGPFKFNFVYKTPINWFLPAFVAYRGSVNWTFNTDVAQLPGHVRVYRSNQSGIPASEQLVFRTNANNSITASWFIANSDSGAAGQALTNTNTNTGLSVSCPNYSKYRFQSTSPSTATLPLAIDDSALDEFVYEMGTNFTVASLRLWSYVGVGTDFGAYYFLNVPTMWQYSTTPIAV